MPKRLTLPIHILVWLFAITAQISGCTVYASCEADEQDCICEEDVDCKLSAYPEEVLVQEDCYPTNTCCEPGAPINLDADMRNRMSWEDRDCAVRVSPVDCEDEECDPHDDYTAECRQGSCVTIHRRI